tara:strand:- start:4345 stop:4716 length:372 start_codon:yes stop_codon:yes gene_type:complete
MKTSKNLKNIKKETENFNIVINKYISGVKKDYKKNLKIVINDLLQRISIGENLDLNTLKEKYIVEKKTKQIPEKKAEDVEVIFDKINIDGETYYVDKNENGKIYDSKSKIVGKVNFDKYEFNS